MKVKLIGIDLAKNLFQICGMNQAGKVVFNRQRTRGKFLTVCNGACPACTLTRA